MGVLGQPHPARSDDAAGDPRIKHIIVLMMENRSFDHLLGLLMSEIPDLRGVHVGDWTNTDDKGTVHSLAAGAAYQGQFLVDPPHDFWSVHQQIYGQPGQPATQQSQSVHAGIRRDLCASRRQPGQRHEVLQPAATADHAARSPRIISCATNWFASLPGPTNPNRAFAHFGTSFGRVDNGPVWFREPISARKRASTVDWRWRQDGQDLLLQPAERDDRDDVSSRRPTSGSIAIS